MKPTVVKLVRAQFKVPESFKIVKNCQLVIENLKIVTSNLIINDMTLRELLRKDIILLYINTLYIIYL